jgi:hypothetical protein
VDFAYPKEEWDAALEATEVHEWDSIDAREKHGPLAAWLADEVFDHDVIGRDPEVITSVFEALEDAGEDEFTPERLIAVLNRWEAGTWRR